MNVDIIGGTGVVGNGIYQALKTEYKVTAYDRSIYNKNKKNYNFNKLKKKDILIHAAGVTNDEIKKKGFKFTLKRHESLIKIIIKHCLKKKIKYFVYISSIRLVDYKIFRFKNFFLYSDKQAYAYCHFKAEQLIKNFFINSRTNVLILRVANVYGFPKENIFNRNELITYSFPMSLIKKNKIILNSSGYQKRSFCSNYNIGQKIIYWLKKSFKKKITVLNVSGHESMTVINFAKLCIQIYQSTFKKGSRLIVKNKDHKFRRIKLKKNFNLNGRYSLNNYIINFFKTFRK